VRWRNWGHTVATEPREWTTPSTEAEVVALVQRAHAEGQRLRVVGGGHSWSAIAAPEDIGVSLDRVTGLVTVDRPAGRVTVRAGMRLHALLHALDVRGLTLPIVGSIAAQSLAGAIATGTHGSSLQHGNLSSLVEAMRLVDGRGRLVTLAPGDPRLDGARVHLGALGVVTELALRVEPTFALAETVEPIPVERVAEALPAIARSAEYVKVWWLPHTRQAFVIRYERTRDAPTSGVSTRRFVDETVVQTLVVPGVFWLSRIPGVGARVARLMARTIMQPRRVGPAALMLSTPMPARHRETEAALPLAHAGEAFDRTRHAIDRERLVVNFLVEARFVRGDRGWLSPAQGEDTCQLGAYCAGPTTDAYFAAFWRALAGLPARPHWGKELAHTRADVEARWPDAHRFFALRDALDPDRTFGSAFHTRVLGA